MLIMTMIEQIDEMIIKLLVNGCRVSEISQIIQRSKRYILYRLSDLKISFNCKTTAQLIYALMTAGLIK